MSKHPLYLTIHGHFYQPPRENPWTNLIEIQESAYPDHDWNDRIAKQCYDTNGASRILNADGKIEEIVNNYEYMSFNFGPTLMSWIKEFRPKTYQRIIDGDKNSAKRLNGHGNAIAQVYNHMIMPLASEEDRITQIKWGIRDFESHFGRKPEGMWLAETAINMDTIVDMIQEGIKFTILAPTQAASIRHFENKEWDSVEFNNIDTTKPYRIYPKDGEGKKLCDGYLDVFFYNGALSTAVGFEHLLRDSNTYIGKILSAHNPGGKDAQLISIGTDGESYGHHEPFGDMCAAYMFKRLSPQHNIKVVNYAYFLEENPPEYEVRLKNAHFEGTAWSCAHGVGRWYRDCGCATGSPPSWNQKWRKPLRDSLELLKETVDEIFLKETPKYTDTDPWELRNEYVDVLTAADGEQTQDFLSQHLKADSNIARDGSMLLQLLEMQKYSMFSYTSCGWFFNDISGIEPIQNMKYAWIAIELSQNFPNPVNVEKFLSILDGAVSNIDKRTGKQLFVEYAIPDMNATHRLIADALFRQFNHCANFCTKVGVYDITVKPQKFGKLNMFSVKLFNNFTWVEEIYQVLALKNEFLDDYLIVLPAEFSLSDLEKEDLDGLDKEDFEEKYPDCYFLTLKDLFPDALVGLSEELTKKSFNAICTEFQEFPEKHGMLTELLYQKQVPLPDYIATPLKMSITAEVYDLLKKALVEYDESLMKKINAMKRRVDEFNTSIKIKWIEERFKNRIHNLADKVKQENSAPTVESIKGLITIADMFHMDIDKTELENMAYELYMNYYDKYKTNHEINYNLIQYFSWLNFYLPEELYRELQEA